jgi:hypothetical protein
MVSPASVFVVLRPTLGTEGINPSQFSVRDDKLDGLRIGYCENAP